MGVRRSVRTASVERRSTAGTVSVEEWQKRFSATEPSPAMTGDTDHVGCRSCAGGDGIGRLTEVAVGGACGSASTDETRPRATADPGRFRRSGSVLRPRGVDERSEGEAHPASGRRGGSRRVVRAGVCFEDVSKPAPGSLGTLRTLDYRIYFPCGRVPRTPVGLVVIVHGQPDPVDPLPHVSGTFGAMQEWLAERGLVSVSVRAASVDYAFRANAVVAALEDVLGWIADNNHTGMGLELDVEDPYDASQLPIAFIGHSAGGVAAAMAAGFLGDRVSSVVALAPAFGGDFQPIQLADTTSLCVLVGTHDGDLSVGQSIPVRFFEVVRTSALRALCPLRGARHGDFGPSPDFGMNGGFTKVTRAFPMEVPQALRSVIATDFIRWSMFEELASGMRYILENERVWTFGVPAYALAPEPAVVRSAAVMTETYLVPAVVRPPQVKFLDIGTAVDLLPAPRSLVSDSSSVISSSSGSLVDLVVTQTESVPRCGPEPDSEVASGPPAATAHAETYGTVVEWDASVGGAAIVAFDLSVPLASSLFVAVAALSDTYLLVELALNVRALRNQQAQEDWLGRKGVSLPTLPNLVNLIPKNPDGSFITSADDFPSPFWQPRVAFGDADGPFKWVASTRIREACGHPCAVLIDSMPGGTELRTTILATSRLRLTDMVAESDLWNATRLYVRLDSPDHATGAASIGKVSLSWRI